MTNRTVDTSADLLCHQCGYDLRAQSQDGKCPECAASVAESIRLAAIPRRPAWRDSDPRWRRRIIAGTWILVLMPLMSVLMQFKWASNLSVPTVFDFRGPLVLSDTFLCNMRVYESLAFCIGVVLLFSKERGRRRGHLDWTRRWGVLCSYVVLVLAAAQVFFITALVLTGIAAAFQNMPLQYQPKVTQLFVDVGTGYLRYGAYPSETSGIVLVVFSSIAMLLACFPLFDALRSTGSRRWAVILLAPLALFSIMYLARAAHYCLGVSDVTSQELFSCAVYFRPELLMRHIAGSPTGWPMPATSFSTLVVESAKWCILLAIAGWLSIAAWRRGKS